MIPSEAVAVRIRELREKRGWTAQQLAERCAEVGAPKLTAASIANVETGRRKAGQRTRIITVEELLAFALALDVPPLQLLTPDEQSLEVTDDLSIDPMRVVTWTIGATPAHGLPSGFFQRNGATLRAYLTAHDAIDVAKAADRAASQAHGSPDAESSRQRRDDALERLAMRLEPILAAGVVPGELPTAWLTEMADRGWLSRDAIPPEKGKEGV